MGWNTQIIAVRAPRAEVLDVLDLLWANGETTSFEEASSTAHVPNAGIAEVGGWTVIVGGPPGMPFDAETRRALAAHGDAFIGVLASVASTYSVWWLHGGRVVRHVSWESGKLESAEGRPLPVEATLEKPAWGFDEDWVFRLLADRTGIEVRALFELTFDVLEFG